jgi:AraC family transcriptional regulator
LVKPGTRDFYQQVVRVAALHVARELDRAIELEALARRAGLSPLHFHRIFRGLMGETVVELHRRLRLERAAHQLIVRDDTVARLAFEAGYETHESFTRAFRVAYAVSPSEFRERARTMTAGCSARIPYQIAARSGLHYQPGAADEPRLHFVAEESTMKVEIDTKQSQRVAALTHIGPYNMISQTFARLDAIVQPAGLLAHPGVQMVAIYQDDPESKPAAELRSEAGIVVPAGVELPPELHEIELPAGRYARTTHVGPYDKLGDTWAALMGSWLPASGQRVASGIAYEAYRKMDHSRPDELETDLYVALA